MCIRDSIYIYKYLFVFSSQIELAPIFGGISQIHNSEKRAVTVSKYTCYPFTARTNRLHAVEIIPPPVEIVQNKQLSESHKRLNLRRMYDDVTNKSF